MPTTTHYEVHPNRWIRVRREEMELDSSPVVGALASGIHRSHSGIADFTSLTGGDFGRVNLLLREAGETFTVNVTALQFNCQHELIGGELHPSFPNNSTGLAVKTRWAVPADMLLVFSQFFPENIQHLTAFSEDREAWRLPVGNLHSSTQLCAGTPIVGVNPQHPDWHPGYGLLLNKFLFACLSLNRDLWNSDLYEPNLQARTRLMFRWKPTDAGMEQLPIAPADPTPHWTQLAEKVSNPQVAQIREMLYE